MSASEQLTDGISLLKLGGPYAVTVLLWLWLNKERTERIAAQTDAKALYEKIITDRTEAGESLALLGETSRNAIRDITRGVDTANEKLDTLIKPRGKL